MTNFSFLPEFKYFRYVKRYREQASAHKQLPCVSVHTAHARTFACWCRIHTVAYAITKLFVLDLAVSIAHEVEGKFFF